MSTTHSSFDQYCISHKTISYQAAAVPGLKFTVSAPWSNLQLCTPSQQILATPLLSALKTYRPTNILLRSGPLQTPLVNAYSSLADSLAGFEAYTVKWTRFLYSVVQKSGGSVHFCFYLWNAI